MLSRKEIILTLLLLVSIVFHVIFGLYERDRIALLENEIFLMEINEGGLERRNVLYEEIMDSQGRRLWEYEQKEKEWEQLGGQYEKDLVVN